MFWNRPSELVQATIDRIHGGMRSDPLNSKTVTEQAGAPAGLLEMPEAPKQPWEGIRRGVPQGSVQVHSLRSSLLGNSRLLRVYTPPGYDRSLKYPALILLDGEEWEHQAAAPHCFDNLIADRAVPPFVAVFMVNPSFSSRGAEYSCNADFPDFLVDELLHWLSDNYSVERDPTKIAVAGVSLGGLASVWTAFRRSDAVGNAITMSGSFWWSPDSDHEGHEYLTREYANSRKRPVRVYQDVGSMEDYAPEPVTHRAANRHFRDVLAAGKYQHAYVEYVGGHQYVNWRASIADGIRYAFRPDGEWRSSAT
jgi:enterochelin esterase family protein